MAPLGFPEAALENKSLLSPGDLVSHYYVRIEAHDRPGVLAKVTGSFGKNGIGIDQVHQRPALEGETTVPVVIWTQEAKESTVREALAAIDALDDVSGESSLIRIEEDL